MRGRGATGLCSADRRCGEFKRGKNEKKQFPPGPPGHQIFNRSQAPLRYLAISTMREPEVAVYPDSRKVGVLARGHGIMSVHRQGDAVDYYDGEK